MAKTRPRCLSVVEYQVLFVSRPLEFLISAVLLAVSLPIQLLVAILIYLQLGPPVIFRQIRAGKNARQITVVKFRTMTDARDASGALLPDEQRQTALTRLIRRLRLDELPQLWHVLTGDMSLVGPRPLLQSTVSDFGRLGELRNSVPPGLTGWAQVSGNTRLSNAEKLAFDLWYVAHRSTGLDFRILAETLLVPLRGEVRHDARLERAARWARDRFGSAVEEVA